MGPEMEQKWTRNGAEMDTKMEQKWAQKLARNGPKMGQKWAQKLTGNGPEMTALANASAGTGSPQKRVKTLCYSNISAKISEMEQYRHPLQRPDLRMLP